MEENMERDRFRHNEVLYSISLIFLIISLIFFAFALYLLPFLIFHWVYDVPEYVVQWVYGLQRDHGFSENGARWFIFFGLIFFSLFAGFISFLSANRIENRIYLEDQPLTKAGALEEMRIKRDHRESIRLALTLSLIALLVFLVLTLLHWLIYIPPPEQRI